MKPINVGQGGSPTTIRLRNPKRPQLVIPSQLVNALLGRKLRDSDQVFVVPCLDQGNLVLYERSVYNSEGETLKAWRSSPQSKTLYISAVNILRALSLESEEWPENGFPTKSPRKGKLVVTIERSAK